MGNKECPHEEADKTNQIDPELQEQLKVHFKSLLDIRNVKIGLNHAAELFYLMDACIAGVNNDECPAPNEFLVDFMQKLSLLIITYKPELKPLMVFKLGDSFPAKEELLEDGDDIAQSKE